MLNFSVDFPLDLKVSQDPAFAMVETPHRQNGNPTYSRDSMQVQYIVENIDSS